jgi:hypothetical protein
MKFLLDQDVYASTARFLLKRDHDVVRAADMGLSRATEELQHAFIVIEPGRHRFRKIPR